MPVTVSFNVKCADKHDGQNNIIGSFEAQFLLKSIIILFCYVSDYFTKSKKLHITTNNGLSREGEFFYTIAKIEENSFFSAFSNVESIISKTIYFIDFYNTNEAEFRDYATQIDENMGKSLCFFALDKMQQIVSDYEVKIVSKKSVARISNKYA
jgi:hypothetical protein